MELKKCKDAKDWHQFYPILLVLCINLCTGYFPEYITTGIPKQSLQSSIFNWSKDILQRRENKKKDKDFFRFRLFDQNKEVLSYYFRIDTFICCGGFINKLLSLYLIVIFPSSRPLLSHHTNWFDKFATIKENPLSL